MLDPSQPRQPRMGNNCLCWALTAISLKPRLCARLRSFVSPEDSESVAIRYLLVDLAMEVAFGPGSIGQLRFSPRFMPTLTLAPFHAGTLPAFDRKLSFRYLCVDRLEEPTH